MLSHNADEILETLWITFEEKKVDKIILNEFKINNNVLDELIKAGSIHITEHNTIVLTDKGKQEGRDIVRRHRLAERLLVDVMDVEGEQINEAACEFEHFLYKGLDDKICTLLGHPKVCPHGKPIPEGRCCREGYKDVRIISTLAKLSPGQKGQIAYIHSTDHNQLQKMMSMGMLPGVEIQLLQTYPSYLFKLAQSQFAVDETIANAIFVRMEGTSE